MDEHKEVTQKIHVGFVTVTMAFTFVQDRDESRWDDTPTYVNERIEHVLEHMYSFGRDYGVDDLTQVLNSWDFETVQE